MATYNDILTTHNDCPNIDMFYNYIEHDINDLDKRRFELHLADCPFCTDALDGLSSQSRIEAVAAVSEINQSIRNPKDTTKAIKPFLLWSVAASLTAILISTGLFLFYDVDRSNELALVKTEKENNVNEPNVSSKEDNEEESLSPQSKVSSEGLQEVEVEESEDLSEVDIHPTVNKIQSQETFISANDEVLDQVAPIVLEEQPDIAQSIPKEFPAEAELTSSLYQDDSDGFDDVSIVSPAPSKELAGNSKTSITNGGGLIANAVKNDKNTSSQYGLYDAIAYAEVTLYNVPGRQRDLSSGKAVSTIENEPKRAKKVSSSKKQKTSSAKTEAIFNTAPTIDNLDFGVNLYNQKKYAEALVYFNTELSITKDNSKAIIFKALAQYQLKNDAEALNTLLKDNFKAKDQYYSTRLWLIINLKKSLGKPYGDDYKLLELVNDSPYLLELEKL